MLTLLAAAAWGQQEACPGVLPAAELEQALDAVDAALSDHQVERADRILDDVVDALRCLDAPLAPAPLGRLARQLAWVTFHDADEAELRSWTWLERDTVGGPWPADAPPVPAAFHAMRATLDPPPLVRADGGWAAPKRGGVWVDGRPSAAPEARSEVLHLVQRVDRKGRVVDGGWMLGADAPSAWLTDDPAPIELPAWAAAPPPPAPLAEPADEPVAEPAEEPAEEPVEEPVAEPAEEPAEEPFADPVAASPAAEHPAAAPAPAFADVFPDCPWRQGPTRASVDGTTVQVNRFRYPARSDDDVAALREVFRACGEFRAARRLSRWRDARRRWFAGADARAQRDAMIRVLLADEPRRAPPATEPPAPG